MLRIWFNRTYSTNVHTIAMLRDNPDRQPVRIFGTHIDRASPVLSACDVSEAEPDESTVGDDYVAWALAFCARHHIDVFVPRLNLELIAAARHRFASAGVAVVAAPASACALLADKAAAYAVARAVGLAVPPYRVVSTGAAVLAAFAELSAEVGTVCLKPVVGVGGEGFRILTSSRPGWDEISGVPSAKVNVENVAAAVDQRADDGRAVPPMMVLPFLTGPEVSVDCLADADGTLLAAIPRTKISRRRLLIDDAAAVAVARAVVSRYKLASLSNTQVRYWAHPGRDAAPLPYLLETNPRMSGGLYQTVLSGLNLPWAGVMQAMGRRFSLPVPRLGSSYTTVSSVVPLSDDVGSAGWRVEADGVR